jgi:hypothetical protein
MNQLSDSHSSCSDGLKDETIQPYNLLERTPTYNEKLLMSLMLWQHVYLM